MAGEAVTASLNWRVTIAKNKPSQSKSTKGNRSSRPKRLAGQRSAGEAEPDRPPQHSPVDADAGQPAELALVGIGASAGGLEALENFFKAMPADSGMAFVLVLHLDPTHESHLVEILRRHTSMPVAEVSGGMRVEANRVYVIPPGAYLTLSGKTLHLSEPAERRGLRLPIDFFFRSLAAEQQQRAIAVILSGTGSDGTLGLREIKAQGGLVVVQDPQEAQYDGMPRAAIATGMVDHVLKLQDMPGILSAYLSHWYVKSLAQRQGESAPGYLQTIIAMLRANIRFDFSGYKLGTLTRRIQRRMSLHHTENPDDYVRLLRESPDEATALFKDLLISVTNFFRDPKAWEELTEHTIGPLVERKKNYGPIRVWVPGCATGEEAYSIAMLLAERLQEVKANCELQIFASDIDADALSVARAGVYPENIVADVPATRLRQFFIKGEHTYRISKEIRDAVVFAEQNLLADPPFARLDLISCRNLLIYLEPEIQKKIIQLFHFALNDGGQLFLGNSETVGTESDLFHPVSKKWRIYRRLGTLRHEPMDVPVTPRNSAVVTLTKSGQQTPDIPLRLSQLVQQLVAERYAPACALIDRQYQVLFLQGPVDRYLKLPTGELAADLLGMARDGLRTKLRTLVRESIRELKRLTETAVRVKREGSYYSVEISVEPIENSAEAAGLMLVTFQDLPRDGQRSAANAARDSAPHADVQHRTTDDSVLLRHLEEELQSTRKELQATIEQQETFSEEMKAANEEVTSVNEELQSTNEELETSKEELQSLNEELTTVNNQLEAKIAELEATSNDLQNLLSSADAATIFLDRSIRIKRFTPATTKLLRLIPTDLGRPLSDVVLNFTDQHLLSDAELVLRDLTPIQREVQSAGQPHADQPALLARDRDPRASSKCYLRRILPYRTEDDRIEGVVITFADITDLKLAAEQLRTARDYAENIVETVREPLLVLDRDLRVRSANRAFYKTFNTTQNEIAGELFHEIANGQWNVPELRRLLKDVLPEHAEFRDLEIAHNFARLGWRRMLLNARSIFDANGKPSLILLAFEDVTDRFQRETAALALREQERVGRELHDSLGQQTTAIGMLAASLQRQLASAGRPEAELAGKLLDRIEQAKAEVRLLSKGLLPVDLDAEGLMSALSELVESTRDAHGIVCRFECEEPVTLEDSFAATHLFLIAKEAVHNAVKHAQAGEIVVRLAAQNGSLNLQVRDDGVGIVGDPSGSESFGIRIMRYRSGLIGANFNIEAAKPRGTVVTCTIAEKEIPNG